MNPTKRLSMLGLALFMLAWAAHAQDTCVGKGDCDTCETGLWKDCNDAGSCECGAKPLPRRCFKYKPYYDSTMSGGALQTYAEVASEGDCAMLCYDAKHNASPTINCNTGVFDPDNNLCSLFSADISERKGSNLGTVVLECVETQRCTSDPCNSLPNTSG